MPEPTAAPVPDPGAAHRKLHAELMKDDEYRTAYGCYLDCPDYPDCTCGLVDEVRSFAEESDPKIARAADLFRGTNVKPGATP